MDSSVLLGVKDRFLSEPHGLNSSFTTVLGGRKAAASDLKRRDSSILDNQDRF